MIWLRKQCWTFRPYYIVEFSGKVLPRFYPVKDGFKAKWRNSAVFGVLEGAPWTPTSLKINRRRFCQGRSRGFESRVPLLTSNNLASTLKSSTAFLPG